MSYACRKKRRYRNMGDAQRAMTNARHKGQDRAMLPIRVYDCGICGGWHLTSQPAEKKTMVAAQRPKNWTDADDARWRRLTGGTA